MYSSTLSLTSAPDGVGGQRHDPTALPLVRKRGTHCTEGWVGPMAVLDGCGKSRPLPRFDPRTVQPVASRYTDCAIPTHGASCTHCIIYGTTRIRCGRCREEKHLCHGTTHAGSHRSLTKEARVHVGISDGRDDTWAEFSTSISACNSSNAPYSQIHHRHCIILATDSLVKPHTYKAVAKGLVRSDVLTIVQGPAKERASRLAAPWGQSIKDAKGSPDESGIWCQ
jgi:hypothetical protein